MYNVPHYMPGSQVDDCLCDETMTFYSSTFLNYLILGMNPLSGGRETKGRNPVLKVTQWIGVYNCAINPMLINCTATHTHTFVPATLTNPLDPLNSPLTRSILFCCSSATTTTQKHVHWPFCNGASTSSVVSQYACIRTYHWSWFP